MSSSDSSVMPFKSFDLDFNYKSNTHSTDPHLYISILVTSYLYTRIVHFHFIPLFWQTSHSHWHLISFFPCKVQSRSQLKHSPLAFDSQFPLFFIFLSLQIHFPQFYYLSYQLCLSCLFQILCSILYLLTFAPHCFPSIYTFIPFCLSRNTGNIDTWERF